MKWGLPLILCFLFTGWLKGQGVLDRTLSLHVKDLAIKNLLDRISEDQGIYFTYTGNLAVMDKKISLQVDGISLKKLLNDLFFDEDLSYTEYQNQIIIRKRVAPMRVNRIRGVVLSSETSAPIEYASIQLKKSGSGVVAGMDGKFEITVSESNLDDTLAFYCIGYEPSSYSIRYLASLDYHKIYLRVRNIALDTVVKAAKKPEIRKEGIHGIPMGSLYLDTHGQQVALYISNDKHESGRLKSVKIYLSGKGNTGTPFRVRVYAKEDGTEGPGMELLPDIVIIRPDIQKGWVSVDLSKYNIRFSESGIFLGIEGIYPGDYMNNWQENEQSGEQFGEDEVLAEALDYGQRIGYSRWNKNNTWHYSISKTWFQLKKKHFNVMLSAEILVYHSKNLK